MNDKEFLEWIYQRLLKVHKENKNVDYMHKLKNIIDGMEDTPWEKVTNDTPLEILLASKYQIGFTKTSLNGEIRELEENDDIFYWIHNYFINKDNHTTLYYRESK